MSIRNLDKIFNPNRVAVIGASDAPGKRRLYRASKPDWIGF